MLRLLRLFPPLLVLLCALLACQAPRRPERPLIGLTSAYEAPGEGRTQASLRVNLRYVEALLEGGGIPVILPAIRDPEGIAAYTELLDGLVLIGGDDIPPAAYGQEPHPALEPMAPERFEFEAALAKRWLAGTKPLLGICLGLQLSNVVEGGSLIQDIPSLVGAGVPHRGEKQGVEHEVQVLPGTRLAGILGPGRQAVFSSHHQAAERIAAAFRVAARSADGVVEALESTDARWRVLVQWHPEQMPGTPHRAALFAAFVEACRSPEPRR